MCTQISATSHSNFIARRLHCVNTPTPPHTPLCLAPRLDSNANRIGEGAGWYVDATEAPWSTNFKMDTYINQELPEYIEKHFPVYAVKSIMGHSMGGHGALTSFLNYPGQYQSVSAFAPICNPSQSEWGRLALTALLGPDESKWERYDTSRLLSAMKKRGEEIPKILISVSQCTARFCLLHICKLYVLGWFTRLQACPGLCP